MAFNQTQTINGLNTNAIITPIDPAAPLVSIHYGLKVVGDGVATNLANGGIGFAKGDVGGADFRAIVLSGDLDNLNTPGNAFGYFFSGLFGGQETYNIGLSDAGGADFAALGMNDSGGGQFQLSSDGSGSISSNSGAISITSGTGALDLSGNDPAGFGVSIRNQNVGVAIARFSSAGVTKHDVFNGVGSPEGVVTGDIGDTYQDIGSATAPMYVKTTNAVNTGWLPIPLTSTGGAGIFSTGSTLNTQAFGVNNFLDLDGTSLTLTESEVQSALPAGTIGYYSVRVDANTCDGITTITFRQNNVDTVVQIVIPAGATGTFSDTVNTIALSPLDLCNHRVDTTASTLGAIDFHSVLLGGFGSNSVVNMAIGGTVTGGTDQSLLFITPAGILAQRAIGVNGDVLTVVGGTPAWQAPSASTLQYYDEPAAAPAVPPSTTSADAIAIGDGALASNTNAYAFGTNAVASGVDSIAFGANNNATAIATIVIGRNSDAIQGGDVAIGNTATANGNGAWALGESAVSTGAASYAIGHAANATNIRAFAIGESASATADRAFAIGDMASATVADTIVLGTNATVGVAICQSSAPTSKLQVGNGLTGSVAFPITQTVASGGIATYTLLVDATAANLTETLPTAIGIRGRIHIIKKVDATANTVTVDTTGGQTIDGAATYVLTAQYEVVRVQSDNANWHVI